MVKEQATMNNKGKLPKREKLPAHIKTMDDVLARDDNNYIIGCLEKDKPNIQYILAIYVDRENEVHYYATENTPIARLNLALDLTKQALLNELNEDDEE
jgi:HEAT repeat protein